MAALNLSHDGRHSTVLDVAVFAVTAVSGFAAYLTLRTFIRGSAQLWITGTLLALMLAYVATVALVPRLKLRLDQAGDNAYYLGLLFTLGSMAFALYDFTVATETASDASGIQQIISNFGIALATTITGIFLRVALHQMRVDPSDIETVSRLELTEASERLRATLDTISSSFGQFHLETLQRQSDVVSEMDRKLASSVEEMSERVSTLTVQAAARAQADYERLSQGIETLTQRTSQLAEAAEQSVARLRGVEPPPVVLAKRLNSVAGALEQLTAHLEHTQRVLSMTGEGAATVTQSIAQTATDLDSLAVRMRNEQSDISRLLTASATDLTNALGPFTTRLDQALRNLQTLEQQATSSAQQSVAAQAASAEVLNRLAALARDLTRVIRASDGDSRGAR